MLHRLDKARKFIFQIANNPGVFEGVTVGFATTGGTATVGVDYELPTEKHCVSTVKPVLSKWQIDCLRQVLA